MRAVHLLVSWAFHHCAEGWRVGGHGGLARSARCRRSQEARRRRGRLRLQRESNGQLSKDPFRRCQNVGPGMICKEKARSTSPHESSWPWTTGRLHREFRTEGHGDIGQIRRWQRENITKRIPLWALSAPTPPRPPSSPHVPLPSMNCARCAPPPATHTVASRDRHTSHAFRFYHPPPLSCISVLCGDRSTAPMSCNQAGRPINHEPRGAGPFNGRETAAFRT